MSDGLPVTVRLAEGVSGVDPAAWDACAGSANPFLSHAFLSALEDSGSVGKGTGWQPLPLLAETADGRLIGAMPAYGKSHSQGEYVFDHSWADAFHRAGGDYYPKLQIAVPFTPVPGPRLLLRDASAAAPLIAAAEAFVTEHNLSSAHATFVEEQQIDLFRAKGWAVRTGSQFHFLNPGYGCFDDFLASLASRKRRAIRKERAAAVTGLDIVHVSGRELKEEHWDAFWSFYQDTGARKWGHPYLTRSFFSLLGERMADRVLLIMATCGGKPIAGALNLIGEEALYGRYWGCTQDVPFLHFELCYYQAIDAAIARKLDRVEAGAQGEHKLARGYVPVPTWSAHYIANPGFRRAVEDFVSRERQAVERDIAFLGTFAPFKKDG